MFKAIRLIALLALCASAALFFFTTAEILPYADKTRSEKALVAGEQYAVVTGTPWATQAAMKVLDNQGSACDAAVAALLMLNVTHGEASAFGGVAPTLYYDAENRSVRSYIGAGKAPAAASISSFTDTGDKVIPSLDIRAQLVPAGPDVIAALLQECGNKSFAELAAPAIALARNGFPMHAIMHRNMDLPWYQRLGMRILLPSTAAVWLPHGWWQPVRLHQKMTFPDLANTLQNMADAETRAREQGRSRKQAIEAMRDYFYRGPIAGQIAQFHRDHNGLLTENDLQNYQGGWEQPIIGQIGDYTFFGNGTWSQGIMEPLVLQILQPLPLRAMGHNSPEYIHTVTQAIELAMSDRDTYVADPDFVAVPVDVLLSPAYALERQSQMTTRAFQGPAPAGEIAGFGGKRQGRQQDASGTRQTLQNLTRFAAGQDTSQISIVDQRGNAVVITPSDFPKSPMLPATGINLGDRMTQFQLDPGHVNALQPGKRPRITPHSVMVFRDGRFLLAFSTPGGDMQAQALVQVFLNMSVFGMDIQQAIAAPRFYSINSPSSFSPHDSTPGGLRLERSLYLQQTDALTALGYRTQEDPDWDKDFGAVGGILRSEDGKLLAGADPREETTAAAH
ncbi:gamma-glutamyltransferase 2. Threonine peptidase. MEROPS family T03 [Pseudomonas pohangensis]|uniref:Gamma-glutamyltransferase 2. Threonine peptidase. MEROPS family T03 n=1 Tax=Pseudomonas pohangensis TaxID=364197 RepID=A0A1H2ED72_9PSED|nr:gamma-glutamyltransferase [Pseudomonas pohangensis]SDT92963.1 gamma-glutamyltransferase 2. Threonine peptidase. MEROPS family T03 [Pseudomonas pohangensis]